MFYLQTEEKSAVSFMPFMRHIPQWDFLEWRSFSVYVLLRVALGSKIFVNTDTPRLFIGRVHTETSGAANLWSTV